MSIVAIAWDSHDIVLAGDRRTSVRHWARGRWKCVGWTEGECKAFAVPQLSMGVAHAGTALVQDYFLSYLLTEFTQTIKIGSPQALLCRFIKKFVPERIKQPWMPSPETFILFAAWEAGIPEIAVLNNQRAHVFHEQSGLLTNRDEYRPIAQIQSVEYAGLMNCVELAICQARQRPGGRLLAGAAIDLLRISRDGELQWLSNGTASRQLATLSEWKRAVATGELVLHRYS